MLDENRHERQRSVHWSLVLRFHGAARPRRIAGGGGPPRVKEETIRNDFSKLFEFEWLRGIRFDTSNASANGASAWSIHLSRKDE